MYLSFSYALLGLLPIVSSHMIMKTPTPFAASKLAVDNSPLHPDGSDFPCKFAYDAEGASNIMPLGSKQELSFMGGATHGGGSCQVSLTYDAAPTKGSKFKVIHSIIGGCPARNTAGNIGTSAKTEDPDKYEFSIPDNLPTGDAVLAWTWFNKVGNREMYMNCAPVKLTGGANAKRHIEKNATLVARGMEAFDALPDMFVANIGNGCTTKDSSDLKFDNPGKSVDIISSSSLAGPVGSCASSSSSSSASGADSAGVGASNAGTSNAGAGASAAGSGSKPESSKDATGGAFYTVTSPEESKQTAASQDPPSGKAPEATSTSSAISNAKPTSTPLAEGPPKSEGSSTSASGSAVNETPGNGAQKSVGSQCSNEGAWNCIDGKAYQRCASGSWSVIMPLAAGTECNSITADHMLIETKYKRVTRVPRAHLRPHISGMKFI